MKFNKYKGLRVWVLLLFAVLLIVMPVSAFEDNFDDGEIASDWSLTGVWTLPSGGAPDGSINYTRTTSTGTATQTIASFKPNYLSIWCYTADSDGLIYFSDSQYIHYDGFGLQNIYFVQDSGSTLIYEGPTELRWLKTEVIRSGSNFIVNVYDFDLLLLATKTFAADTVPDTTYVKMQKTDVGYIYFDEYILTSVAPTTQTGIEWNADSYTEGDTGSYTWAVAGSFWDLHLYKFRNVVTRDGVEVDSTAVGQTGTGYINMDTVGNYIVDLQKAFIVFGSWSSLDSDTVFCNPETDSYINAPSYIPTQQNFTISYSYGFTPTNPVVIIKKYDEFGGFHGAGVGDWYDLTGSADATVSYELNATVISEGTYLIILSDLSHGEIEQVTCIAEFDGRVPQVNVEESFIDSDRFVYGAGSNIFLDYGIDNTNYSAYTILADVYNTDNNISYFNYVLTEQVDSRTIPIYQIDGPAGNYQVRLISLYVNITTRDVLDYENITITSTDQYGYLMKFSKNPVAIGESFTVLIRAPDTVTLEVIKENVELYSSSFNGSNDTPAFKYSTEGDYRFNLITDSGITRVSDILTVSGDAIPSADVDDATPIQYLVLMNFMMLPIFWGLIIFIGVVVSVAQQEGVSKSSVGIVAFLMANMLSIVGMFAPYTIYMLIATWLGAGIFFSIGKKISGQDEGY